MGRPVVTFEVLEMLGESLTVMGEGGECNRNVYTPREREAFYDSHAVVGDSKTHTHTHRTDVTLRPENLPASHKSLTMMETFLKGTKHSDSWDDAGKKSFHM